MKVMNKNLSKMSTWFAVTQQQLRHACTELLQAEDKAFRDGKQW